MPLSPEQEASFGKEWLDCTKQLPIVGRNYWISDGKDVALATWNMERMQWQFLYHYSVFKPSLITKYILILLVNFNNILKEN